MDLRARIAALPERLREVLVLRYYEGMSEGEMAEALAIPRGTVKSRLHHALRELRRAYQGDGE
jgi:RNA polymerase sigma-70 factor (ECF subfamily)